MDFSLFDLPFYPLEVALHLTGLQGRKVVAASYHRASRSEGLNTGTATSKTFCAASISGANCASNLPIAAAFWPRFLPLLEPTFGAKCASNLQVSNALWARFVPLLEPTFGAKCASNLPISNARWPRLLQRGASKCTPHRLGLPSPCRDALTLISAFSKRHSLGTKRVLLTRAEGPSR